MFKLARVSPAAPRLAIPRRAMQPSSYRLYSSENTTTTVTTDSAPAPNAATSTAQPAGSTNGAGSSSQTIDSKAPARQTFVPKSKPAPAPAPAPARAPPSSIISAAAKAAPSTRPGPGGLPFYQPKTIGFSNPAPPGGESSGRDVDIDWENSYHGISTRPVTPSQFKVLMEPISEQDIEVKPDGIIYLPEIKYRRRLNEAFGPMGWGLIPRSEPTLANGVATREYALVIGGRFVAQAQGENSYFNPEGMPSAVEGCKSNALMRCCKDLGIASELWDPVFIRTYKAKFMKEVWVEHMTTKKKRQLWFKANQINVAYPWKKV